MRSASSFSGRRIRASTSRSTGPVHDVSRRFVARLRRLPTNRHRTRHLLNQEFMQALLLNFRHEGKKAIEKVARNQPGVYLKILASLVPRETKVEHSGGVKAMSDEEIEQAIELIQTTLAARAGEAAKVIEGTAEPAALPAPNGQSSEAALEPAPLPKSKHN